MNIFIAGSREIYALDKVVVEKLNKIYSNKYTVLVGDAKGVDTAVQKYFANLEYDNVIIYASEGKARNNVGNWIVKKIDVSAHVNGFDYYKLKDKAMSDNADYGFMIWNGKSKGTLNNIINLINSNKTTVVYLTKTNSFYDISSLEKLNNLVAHCNQETHKIYERLNKNTKINTYQQITMF